MSPEIRGGLSDFFRNASEAHRKKVYEEVLKKATEAQLATLSEAQRENLLDKARSDRPNQMVDHPQ